VKQGSGAELPARLQMDISRMYSNAVDNAKVVYDSLLAQGVAPEQARMVLPQSMMTSWIETGSLAYWARLVNQRTDPHAQKEIENLARQVGDAMAEKFPVSWSALVKGVG
jgi:thymidylate synthase (FAD)